MKILIIVCIFLFALATVLNTVEAIAEQSTDKIGAIMGWFCAFVWAANALMYYIRVQELQQLLCQ